MRKIDKKKKTILAIVLIPLIFVAQYYIFKFGVISPMIKGVNIKIIQGEYIQDIDKYVVKLGEPVILSPGDYIKIPSYAKDPKVKFRILDNSDTIEIKDNSEKEDNTVILEGLKKGYTSIALMKNSRVLQKATILVVDPTVESLNVTLDGNLKYVGDKGEFSSTVEVDYKEFNNTYDVIYESSNENVLRVNNNKVEAVGVGNATIYAKSKDKVEALRYNIIARVKDIEIESSFNISIGQNIKLKPKIITFPGNLKPPVINYKFSQVKLPIERCVSINKNGGIIGIREGSEKITISCGVGENKKIQVITINVKEEPIKDNIITNLFSRFSMNDNVLNIEVSWDVLNGATNYDVYIKNNLIGSSEFELYTSVTQETFIKNKKINIVQNIDKDVGEFNFDIYIEGRNEEGSSNPSNIINIIGNTDSEEKPEDPEEPEQPEQPEYQKD
ncbi:MAG: Ig-like domain-containing protein [Terrisporobacter sp.]